ncbi:MAG: DUF1223 domain-containing protein [Phycisphaerales bacterium]
MHHPTLLTRLAAPALLLILVASLFPARTATADDGWRTLALDGGDALTYQLLTPPDFDPARAHRTLLALPPGGQDQAMVEAGLGRYWREEAARRGWVVIAPAAPASGRFFGSGAAAIEPLLDAVAREVMFDGGRVHVAGVSNGGRSAFHVATRSAARFHSILALPGGAEEAAMEQLGSVAAFPITMYVGGKDARWITFSERTRKALATHGNTAALTVLEGQGHVVDVAPALLFDELERAHRIAATRSAESRPGTAVAELYTSEGCSSCPPADAVLADLLESPRVADGSLILLSFHVDYWDRLGWPDRFAAPAFTRRQREANRLIGEDRLYTPQLIVGGTDGFVGSDRPRADRAIAAIAAPVAPGDGANAERREDADGSGQPALRARRAPATAAKRVAVEVQTIGIPASDTIFAFLVQPEAASDVTRGENAGRTLEHHRIVRAMASRQAAEREGAGEGFRITLKAPAGVDPDACAIVALAQSPVDGTVHAALNIGPIAGR